MKLQNATLRPGRVLEVLDDGSIQVEAPGLFSREDGANAPAITPINFGGGANAFSMPKKGDEVWVMDFTDNPQQIFYLKKDNPLTHNADVAEDGNTEGLCKKSTGTGYATLKHSDSGGWDMSSGTSKVKVDSKGTAKIETAGAKVEVTNTGIKLGGDAHSVAYGDKVQEALEEIILTMNDLRDALACNCFTVPASWAIGNVGDRLEAIKDEIASQTVTTA